MEINLNNPNQLINFFKSPCNTIRNIPVTAPQLTKNPQTEDFVKKLIKKVIDVYALQSCHLLNAPSQEHLESMCPAKYQATCDTIPGLKLLVVQKHENGDPTLLINIHNSSNQENELSFSVKSNNILHYHVVINDRGFTMWDNKADPSAIDIREAWIGEDELLNSLEPLSTRTASETKSAGTTQTKPDTKTEESTQTNGRSFGAGVATGIGIGATLGLYAKTRAQNQELAKNEQPSAKSPIPQKLVKKN